VIARNISRTEKKKNNCMGREGVALS